MRAVLPSNGFSGIVLAFFMRWILSSSKAFVICGGDAAKSGSSGSLSQKLLNSGSMSEPRNVLLYTRKGCPLRELVKESLVKLHQRGGFSWSEVDVDSNEELRRAFNDEVPVVFIDGRKAFKYRMDEREFLRRLGT